MEGRIFEVITTIIGYGLIGIVAGGVIIGALVGIFWVAGQLSATSMYLGVAWVLFVLGALIGLIQVV